MELNEDASSQTRERVTPIDLYRQADDSFPEAIPCEIEPSWQKIGRFVLSALTEAGKPWGIVINPYFFVSKH